MSIKVLVAAKAFPPVVGGVESYSEFIARAYKRAGLTPVVLTAFGGRVGWHERDYPEGRIRVLNVGMGPQPIVFLKMLMASASLRLTQDFDFLHATTWRAALTILPVRKRIPFVLTVHGQEVLNYPSFLRRPMIWALVAADLVVTVSHVSMEAAQSALFGARPKGVWQVNFNGLSYLDEAATFVRTPADPSRIRITSFARLAARKNIEGCLYALARLKAEGIDNFHYTIGGTGPLKAKIELLIEELELGNLVTMIGYVKEEDIPDLYRETDVFLHPQTASVTGRDLEGFGLAIADSISFGAAAVVGKDGGPRDFVAHGERGLVVDGNDTSNIADALRSLLMDTYLLERLSSNGRDWCLNNLSWDRHVTQLLSSLPFKEYSQAMKEEEVDKIGPQC
ncbi:glycosyltransferase family 1 protein [Pseudorhizobium halotolerans]|uniref:Glycosyltransferase family 1 protein n=1 Tax=Pseudorhizobium halotolerans TaxID=1233081 RepID=A0ABM8PFK6_9HYPH|nr:glycosyltransferase family 4 protein [Pseudorhizobium halotolerans]CAD7026870.1 glycosyltransferase family 1 protein [Pseudorhizobium halotolerans]